MRPEMVLVTVPNDASGLIPAAYVCCQQNHMYSNLPLDL
jgi:hypothetical protein